MRNLDVDISQQKRRRRMADSDKSLLAVEEPQNLRFPVVKTIRNYTDTATHAKPIVSDK